MDNNRLKKGAELDLRGLEWVWDFGWLRPQELGRLLWPKVRHATKNAERICRKWESNGLIIRRELPNHNGTAIVLSSKGADLLCEIGINAKTGKDIGSTRPKTEEEKREDEVKRKKEDGKKKYENTVWIPPASWRHDLLCAGVLSICHEMGHEIFPEAKLRRKNTIAKNDKIPDGIIKWRNPNNVILRIWLEVEASRKSGAANGDKLAHSIIDALNEQSKELSGIRCNQAMIAINPNQLCERGYSLNHKEIIKNKIEKLTPIDINICFLELKLTGLGVSGFEIVNEKVESNEIARTVASLDKKWDKKRKSERIKGRESELYSDDINGLDQAEFWKENEKWFLEYGHDDDRIKKEFDTQTAAKRFAARVHLDYKKAQEAKKEAEAGQRR